VWNPTSGILVRSLDGHAHWVNHIALNSDHVQRNAPANAKEAALTPQQRYDAALGHEALERMVSASDDHTMYLWEPANSKKPLCRMTGHVQPINHVSFSPNGRLIASASFDKSIRIWNGITGKYLTTLRGHVGAVYQVAWSSDSRLLVSASKDSTIKLFDVDQTSKTFGKLVQDLPGHAGTHFTCFTVTKVRLLTQQEMQTKCLQSTGALTAHALLQGARTALSSCGGTKKKLSRTSPMHQT
jgi:ribosome assembly protein 4